jgi:hypothetical protein
MDPLSLTASIIGVASAGLRLSTSLYRYTETVINADKNIRGIARDLSTTSSMIRELGTLLEQDRGQLRCENALATANEALQGCDEVFKEIQKVLDDNMNLEEKGATAMSKLKKLKWPLVEPRIHVLQQRLERLKNTLVLVLSVVNYAKEARELSAIEDRYDPDLYSAMRIHPFVQELIYSQPLDNFETQRAIFSS